MSSIIYNDHQWPKTNVDIIFETFDCPCRYPFPSLSCETRLGNNHNLHYLIILDRSFLLKSISFLTRFERFKKSDLAVYANREARKHLVPLWSALVGRGRGMYLAPPAHGANDLTLSHHCGINTPVFFKRFLKPLTAIT